MENTTFSSDLPKTETFSDGTSLGTGGPIVLPNAILQCLEKYTLDVSGEPFSEIIKICDFLRTLDLLMAITAVVPGVPGNILAVVTVLTFSLSAYNFCIILLAVGDFIALSFQALEYVFFRYGFHIDNWFQSFIIFSGVFPNWILVIICMERLVAVRFPLHARRIFTLRNSKIGGLVLGIIVLAMAVSNALTNRFNSTWWLIRQCFYGMIPVVLILVGTILIVVELRTEKRRRKRLTNQSITEQATGSDNSITMMLAAVAVSFLALMTPQFIASVLFFTTNYGGRYRFRKKYMILHTVALNLTFLSHAVNFYLYVLTSRTFRKRLFHLLTCKSRNNAQSH